MELCAEGADRRRDSQQGLSHNRPRPREGADWGGAVLKKAAAHLLQGALHRYPFYSGCGRIANLAPFHWLLRDPAEDTIWARLDNGAQIRVKRCDWVGNALYFFGDLDPKLTWVARRLLRSGDTVLDIGSNVGLMSLYAATLVGTGGSVHAFDPQSDLIEMLEESRLRNGFTHIVTHAVALGEEDTELELFIPRKNLGMASLVLRAHDDGTRVKVPVRRASSYLAGLPIRSIRLVKLDVEGFEETVLRGAFEFFREVRPEAILCELLERGIPFRQQKVVEVLNRLGYAYLDLGHGLARMRTRLISREQGETSYGHDVLAVRPELLGLFR